MSTKDLTDLAADMLDSLFFPIRFMLISVSFLPGTILSLFVSRNFTVLLSPPRLKDAWFARFWGVYGANTRKTASINASPLIQEMRGVVLDIGPGSGEWLHVFDKNKVTKIYGVEPNRDHYDSLRRRIKDAGLNDIYEIVECGVEGLSDWGLGDETVDSVVTLLCLCSVEDPRAITRELYGKLKNGGIWAVYEHVITKQGGWINWYQALINVPWPHCLGGCSIRRDTDTYLREAGDWSKIDLKHPEDEKYYSVLPHIMGFLTK